jgi:hypothetical protein
VRIVKLHGEGQQLVEPWKADMASDDDKLGKVEQHFF